MPVYKDKTNPSKPYYYSIHYVDGFGKSHRLKSKRFATKKEAEKAFAMKKLELGKTPASAVTFNQAAALYLDYKKPLVKPSSYAKIKHDIFLMLETLGDVDINKLTVQQYQHALNNLEGKTARYKNEVLMFFKQLLSFANKRFDVYTSVPGKFDNFKDPGKIKKEMKFITYDEFQRFIAVVDDPMYNTLFTLLFYLGLRIGEANALQWSKIDFANKQITINATVNTKYRDNAGKPLVLSPKTSNSATTLPLPNVALNALKTFYGMVENFPGFNSDWFVFGQDRPLPETTIKRQKDLYFKKAGIEPIRLHDFRHSCAAYLLNSGYSIMLCSKWLRHSSISMTLDKYGHLYKSELYNLVTALNENCT